MRTCPTCGNHNENRCNFCGQCGTRIANVCPGCSYENLLTQPFCGSCGKQLIQETLFAPKSAAPESNISETPSTEKSDINVGPLEEASPVSTETSVEALNDWPAEAGQTDSPSERVSVASGSVAATTRMDTSAIPIQRQAQSTQAAPSIAPEPIAVETLSAIKMPTYTGHTVAGQSPVLPESASQEPFPYKPPVFGQHRTIRQALVGYDATLTNLTHDLKTFVGQGAKASGQVVVLSASDGLGKSNLIQNARNVAVPMDPATGDEALLWFGAQHYRCFSPNRILAQGWVELLQNLIGLTFEGGAKETVHQQIREFLQSLYQNQPVHPEIETFLLELFGVYPAQPLAMESLSKAQYFTSMMFEILKRMASIRPLVLMLEDLQFADVATLDILTQLLSQRLLQQVPILLLLTHSRDFYLAGPLEQALQQVPHKEYVISDLNDSQVEQFLNDGPLGGQIQHFPVSVLTALIESGHGLPIYLEELLRLFYMHGVVTLDPETNKFVPGDTQKLQHLHIPPSLPEVLEARIGTLSAKARYILQLASVLGERFSITLLLSLSQDTDEEFQAVLNELFNHGLLLPDMANTGRFRHGLLWRAVYNHIEPELKTQLHQLVSQTLENDFTQNVTVNLFLMAHHAEQGQLINRALSYWELAGVRMAQIGQLAATNHAMFRALQLIHLLQTQVLVVDQKEALANQEEQLYLKLGMFNSQANPDVALTLLSRVIHRRRESGDTGTLLEPYGFLSRCYESKGDIVQALASVDESLTLLPKAQYPLEYAALLTTKVGYLYQLGRLAEAREWIEQEIEPIFSQHSLEDEPDYFKTSLNARLFLAEIMLWQCQPKAFELFDQCLTLAREKQLEGLAIEIQLAKTRGYLKRGEYQRCDEEADGLLAQIEALDEQDWFFAQWGLLAMEYHLHVGDWESARQLMLTVVSRAESVNDYQTSILAQLYGAYVAFHFGQADKAKPLLEQAVATSTEYAFTNCQLQGWQYLAELALAQQDAETALQLAKKALQLASQPNVQNQYFYYQFICMQSRAMMTQNTIKEAGRMLEQIWPELVATQFTPLIAEAASCIGELYKNLATEAPSEISKQHLIKSVQFFQKSQGLWLDLNNKHQVNRIRAAMPGL